MPPMMSSVPTSAGAGGGGPPATAIEFTCLFTHDLRRKQKRWEDGRLKYHTFNRRVMVYDERGNFIGDTHWQRGRDFDEGDEFQLERGSVIVQVVECVGRQEQDLSELLDKRAKEKEQRQARVATRPPISVASPHTTPLPSVRGNDHFQTRHRPLNHLLGTPTGHHGRAIVPSESPFELRQRINENPGDEAESRAAKRRKCDTAPPAKTTFAQNLFGATLSLSAVPLSSAPLRRPVASSAPSEPDAQDEPPPHPEPVRPVDRALPSRAAPYSGFSRASIAATRSRAPPEPVSAVVARDEESPEPVQPQRSVARRPEKQTSRPTTSTVRSPDSDGDRLNSPDDENLPRAAVNITAPARPKTIRTTVPSLLRKHLERGPEVAVVPEKGASFSQAIVLDEDDGNELAKADRPDARARQKQGGGTAGSKRAAPNPEKRKPAKRNRLLSLAAQPPSVETSAPSLRSEAVEEPPPREERTELRLKPRQKRGLLVMAEKKDRTKQRKRQETTRELTGTDHPTTRTTNAVTPAPRPALAPQPANPGSTTAQRYNPFDSSPPDACDPAPQGDSPWAPPDDDQSPWEMDEAADEATRLPEQQKPPHRNLCNNPGDVLSQPTPPRVRDGKSGSESSARNLTEPTDASIADRDHLSAGSDAEATSSSPPRQARRTRSAAGQGLGRLRRREPESEQSESDSEELPQPPARPHLARLGRKGIRSRELIGYLPSSSPVVPPPFGPGAPGFRAVVATTTLPGPSASEGVLIPPATPPLLDKPEEPQSSPPRALSWATSPAGRRHSSQSGTAVVGEVAIEGPSEERTNAATSTPQSPRRHSLTGHTPTVSPRGDRMEGSAATKVSTGDLEIPAAPEEETTPTTTVQKGGSASPQTTHAADSSSAVLRSSPPPGSSSLINPPQHHHQQQQQPNKSLINNNQPTPTSVNPGVTHPATTRVEGLPPPAPEPVSVKAGAPPPPTPVPVSVKTAPPPPPPPAAVPVSLKAAAPPLPAAVPVSVKATAAAPPAAAPVSEAAPPPPPEAAAAPVSISVSVAGANPPTNTTTTRPRIANPATRGRKAALKSHAAGQAPQPVLPAPLPEVLHHQRPHPPAAAAAARGMVGAVAGVNHERPKRTMRFPGFVSVGGGGPWSREAFDLLEGGRPGAG